MSKNKNRALYRQKFFVLESESDRSLNTWIGHKKRLLNCKLDASKFGVILSHAVSARCRICLSRTGVEAFGR